MSFGAIVRLERNKKGIPLSRISSACGVSISYLSDIESGRRKAPSETTVEIIADTIGVDDETRTRLFEEARISRIKLNFDLHGRSSSEVDFMERLHRCWQLRELDSPTIERLSELLPG